MFDGHTTANSNTYGAPSGPFHPVPSLTFKWFRLAEGGLAEVPDVSFSLAHVIGQDSFSEPRLLPLLRHTMTVWRHRSLQV